MKVWGAQSQRFDGIVQAIASSQPAVWKLIDPDSDILRNIKSVSLSTTTIVRIYTGAPTVDDASQHPDPEQYGYDYATLVYSRVQDPSHMDYLESENEPNDHYNNLTEFIKRLNAFLVGFSRRAKELGFRPLGPNFSTGYPEVYVPNTDYTIWPDAWQGLSDGLRAIRDARGALSLHEYDSPDLFRLWSDSKQRGYLVGRYKAIYASLPSDLQSLPLWVTEFGIDWLTQGVNGGFWHNRGDDAYQFMIDQSREAWTRIYSVSPQLKGIVFFLWGTTDPKFDEYDIRRTEPSISAFTQFFSEEVSGANMQPTPAQTVAVVPFLVKASLREAYGPGGLGQPVYGQYVARADDGELWDCWVFLRGGQMVSQKDPFTSFDTVLLFDPRTGAIMDKPLPWPTGGSPIPPSGIPPYAFPQALADNGACGEEGHPIAGKPFYRVTSGAVLQGVSAFATIFLKGMGAQVVNLFPDGHGEVFTLINDGNVTFNFGANSAFSDPCTGPFTMFVAEGAVKNPDTKVVTWKNVLSDKVKSVGDWRAEHSEWRIQFAQVQ